MNENRKLRAMMLAQQTLIGKYPTDPNTGLLTLRVDDSGESHGCVSFDIYLDDKKLIGFREMKKETVHITWCEGIDRRHSDKINILLTIMNIPINSNVYLSHKDTNGGDISISDHITIYPIYKAHQCEPVTITEDMCITIFDRVSRVVRPTIKCIDSDDDDFFAI